MAALIFLPLLSHRTVIRQDTCCSCYSRSRAGKGHEGLRKHRGKGADISRLLVRGGGQFFLWPNGGKTSVKSGKGSPGEPTHSPQHRPQARCGRARGDDKAILGCVSTCQTKSRPPTSSLSLTFLPLGFLQQSYQITGTPAPVLGPRQAVSGEQPRRAAPSFGRWWHVHAYHCVCGGEADRSQREGVWVRPVNEKHLT